MERPRSGVPEVVESHDGNAYRAVYTVRFEESGVRPARVSEKVTVRYSNREEDVDLVAERLKTAERDYEEHYGNPKR